MGQIVKYNQLVTTRCVQKSHTKVLLLFFFRSHDGAAETLSRRSSADDINHSNAEFAGISGSLIVRRGERTDAQHRFKPAVDKVDKSVVENQVDIDTGWLLKYPSRPFSL